MRNLVIIISCIITITFAAVLSSRNNDVYIPEYSIEECSEVEQDTLVAEEVHSKFEISLF